MAGIHDRHQRRARRKGLRIAMSETWKAVPGFEGAYEVSDLGRVRSVKRTIDYLVNGKVRSRSIRERILVAPLSNYYPHVALFRSGRGVKYRVHELVLLAFKGPAPAGHEGCHRDDVKTNNVLSNLQWGTNALNVADRIANGRQARGIKQGAARLNDMAVKEIRASTDTNKALADRFGVSPSVVSEARRGITWAHVECGE